MNVSWKKHISLISAKGISTCILIFLKQNIKTYNSCIIEVAYKIYMYVELLLVEYSPSVWSPWQKKYIQMYTNWKWFSTKQSDKLLVSLWESIIVSVCGFLLLCKYACMYINFSCFYSFRGPHGRLVYTKCALPSINKVYYYYYYILNDYTCTYTSRFEVNGVHVPGRFRFRQKTIASDLGLLCPNF